ncbi:MAG: hypothetical protein LBS02_04940 [Hungatella sp.]|jgi:hypothetical protein|nr:hypothetical protein [Hungatella sp.]
MAATEAWKKYQAQLGFQSKQEFLDAVFKFYKEQNPELGCIQIMNVDFYETPVSLLDSKVDFSPYIVSGKKISIEECQRIDRLEMEVKSGTEETN